MASLPSKRKDPLPAHEKPEQPVEQAYLNDRTRTLLDQSDAARIQAIQQGSWLPLEHAKKALERMDELLNYPRITRMPNMLLVGPSFSGKTSILERFVQQHLPDIDPSGETSICPVVMVEAPSKPDIADFYSRILDALMCPYKPTAPAYQKYAQIKRLFKELEVRVLIVDEIQHLIAGSLTRQREFRNALKSLGNETKVCIVAAGIEDAYLAFNADPQMSSRFTPLVLPTWKPDKGMGRLLRTLERRTPLKKPSGLVAPGMMLLVHQRSEGVLGDICDLIKEAAIAAIRTKTECITPQVIEQLDWVPPSKRKQYRPIL